MREQLKPSRRVSFLFRTEILNRVQIFKIEFKKTLYIAVMFRIEIEMVILEEVDVEEKVEVDQYFS